MALATESELKIVVSAVRVRAPLLSGLLLLEITNMGLFAHRFGLCFGPFWVTLPSTLACSLI
jgi:hypothetical protein